MDEWITTNEALKIIRRSRGRLHQLLKQGIIGEHTERLRLFVSRADCEAFAANPPKRGRPKREQ